MLHVLFILINALTFEIVKVEISNRKSEVIFRHLKAIYFRSIFSKIATSCLSLDICISILLQTAYDDKKLLRL